MRSKVDWEGVFVVLLLALWIGTTAVAYYYRPEGTGFWDGPWEVIWYGRTR